MRKIVLILAILMVVLILVSGCDVSVDVDNTGDEPVDVDSPDDTSDNNEASATTTPPAFPEG